MPLLDGQLIVLPLSTRVILSWLRVGKNPSHSLLVHYHFRRISILRESCLWPHPVFPQTQITKTQRSEAVKDIRHSRASQAGPKAEDVETASNEEDY